MLDKPGYEVLIAAPNLMEAQFIAGALETDGIPTHVDADHLADEFAMSQKMMGIQRVRVMVPTERLADARAALDTLRAARAEQGDDIPWDQPDGESDEAPPAPAPDSARGAYRVWIVLFALAAVVFAFLYWQERSIKRDGAGSDGVFTWRWEKGRYVTRWQHNGKVAIRPSDRQGDGYEERIDYYDRDGRLTMVSLDENQDGNADLSWHYTRDRRRDQYAYAARDHDEDGHAEEIVYRAKDGKFWRWLDEDGDGYWEVRELVEDGTGKVLMRHEDEGEAGFRQTK